MQKKIQTDNKLKAYQAYMQLFQESALPQLIFSAETLMILAANKSAIAYYQYPENTLLSMAMLDLQPETDRMKALQQLILLETRHAKPLKMTHVLANGLRKDIVVVISPTYFKNHKAYAAAICPQLTTNTSSKEESATLDFVTLQKLYMFESMVQTQSQFVLRLNKNGLLIFANQAFLQAIAIPEPTENMPFLPFLSEDSAPSFFDAFNNCLSNQGLRKKVKVQMPAAHKKILIVDFELLAIPDDTNNLTIQAIGKVKHNIKPAFGNGSPYESYAQISFDLNTKIIERFEYLQLNPVFELFAKQRNLADCNPFLDTVSVNWLLQQLENVNFSTPTLIRIEKSEANTAYHIAFYGEISLEHNNKRKFRGLLLVFSKQSAYNFIEENTNKRLSQLLDILPNGVAVVNNQMHITYVNETIRKLLKQSTDKLINMDLSALLQKNSFLALERKLMPLIASRKEVNFEIYYKKQDAHYAFAIYPVPEGSVILLRDITKQRQSNIELSRNRQNLSSLINATPDYIWSVDVGFKLISANRNFIEYIYKRTGILLEVGKSVYIKSFGEETNNRWAEYYHRAFQGEPFQFEESFLLNNGQTSVAEVNFNPILDDAGIIIGVGCFARDVTARKRQDQQLRAQNTQLLNIAWKQSHEVRGPLANILGLLNVFNQNNPSDPMNIVVIEKMKEAAQRLDTIIQEIIYLSDSASRIKPK